MTVETTVPDGVDELQKALADDAAFDAWGVLGAPSLAFTRISVSRSGGDVALAEDLTQQTFTAAIDQRSRYDGRSDTVTWLCGIARHKLADHFRAIERTKGASGGRRWTRSSSMRASGPSSDSRTAR